jgi:alcohol dehydrogenase
MSLQSNLLSFDYVAAELRLYSGQHSLDALVRELKRNGCQRAVAVSGQSVARSDAMDLLRAALGPVLVGESRSVKANSPVPAVEETARVLEELAADAVIAIGGGSAAVTARAASILLAEKRPVQELCTRRLPGGEFESPRLAAAKLSQFVVPTTPSTAFAKAGSAVHDPQTGRRMALFDPKTRAKGVFLHPEFLRSAPSDLVQSASLNTLSNAVEALESPRCDPFSEAMLLQALRLTSWHLPHLSDGEDEARGNLAIAAVLCGRGTEQSGGGLASVLAHAIGHRSHAANGLVNAIVLPHTTRFNRPQTEHRAARIAESLRFTTNISTDNTEVADVLDAFIEALLVPRRLREIGVARADLCDIANAAMSDWFIKRNPRPVSGADEVLSILEAAW